MSPPTYVYSGNCYVATADQTTFSLTSSAGNAIPYLDKSHIKVRTSDDEGSTWTSLTSGTDFTFANPAVSIILTTPAAVGTWVDVQRSTPLGSIYVQFQAGSLLTSEQLNEAERYSLYCDQEIVDGNVDFSPSDIGLDSTDDLPEGSVNLYYTDERVQALLDAEGYEPGGGGTGGVTKIIAGSNIGITPASGVGEVTINATGGGSGGGIPEAPLDGQIYGRQSAGWTSVTIPDAPVQSDWSVTDSTDQAFIKNKPSWTQSDWNVTDASDFAFIKNKPSIPTVSTPTLQEVCTEGTVTNTKIQAAGFRVDLLTTLP